VSDLFVPFYAGIQNIPVHSVYDITYFGDTDSLHCACTGYDTIWSVLLAVILLEEFPGHNLSYRTKVLLKENLLLSFKIVNYQNLSLLSYNPIKENRYFAPSGGTIKHENP
jgi:hypothetical protein